MKRSSLSFKFTTVRHVRRYIPIFTRKVKVKVKLTLEQTMKAQRGSRGIDLLFL